MYKLTMAQFELQNSHPWGYHMARQRNQARTIGKNRWKGSYLLEPIARDDNKGAIKH